uniref:Uncharacterized protein n=1 Tax=Bactrocera dorsalis TaxID=27457 RepID=A0A034V1R4_BACDO
MIAKDPELHSKAKTKKRMACPPTKHVQQSTKLNKDESSEDENIKKHIKKRNIKGALSSDEKEKKSTGYLCNEFEEVVMSKLSVIQHRETHSHRERHLVDDH